MKLTLIIIAILSLMSRPSTVKIVYFVGLQSLHCCGFQEIFTNCFAATVANNSKLVFEVYVFRLLQPKVMLFQQRYYLIELEMDMCRGIESIKNK